MPMYLEGASLFIEPAARRSLADFLRSLSTSIAEKGGYEKPALTSMVTTTQIC